MSQKSGILIESDLLWQYPGNVGKNCDTWMSKNLWVLVSIVIGHSNITFLCNLNSWYFYSMAVPRRTFPACSYTLEGTVLMSQTWLGGAKQHLSFAHFRVSKPGNYLVLLTCYSVFTSTVTQGFLVWLLLCCAIKMPIGYLIISLFSPYICNVYSIWGDGTAFKFSFIKERHVTILILGYKDLICCQ